MKNIILISILLISISVKANKNNDSIIKKYFLSNKVKELIIIDSNNNYKTLNYSRKGYLMTQDWGKINDTFYRALYYPSGNLRGTGKFINNKKDGQFRYYIDIKEIDKSLYLIYHFKNGKAEGENIILKQHSIFKYDTLFIINYINNKQDGPSVVNYENKIILTYFCKNKEILTLSYYKIDSSISFKFKKRRIKKYNLDINTIISDIKKYIPNAPLYKLKDYYESL